MTTYLIRRIAFLFFTLLSVSIAIFAITELAPGNIAINVLGNTITPAQEASFNAQNGLDQPPLVRYIRWMFGSDWQVEAAIGHPVEQIYNARAKRWEWWAIDRNSGIPFRNFSPDGETIFRIELQPDGSTSEVEAGDGIWKTDAQGQQIFWGVDANGRAARWTRGADRQEQSLTKSGWVSVACAPDTYVPLQAGLLRGDPGISFTTRQPVAETLVPRLLNTLFLAGIAFVFIMPLALLAGIIAGLNEGRTVDRVLSIGGLMATATPEFASGVFLVVIFSVWLKWLPGAVVLPSGTSVFSRPEMLVLPVLTLTLIELGYVMRVTRASMVEVMRTNYIRTAILKGLPYRMIIGKHALRNALMAPITVIMLHINWLVGGVVVVESLFGYPGLGRYILESALNKDVFAIEAATMVLVIIAVVTQLLADIIYIYLNPRIRYS